MTTTTVRTTRRGARQAIREARECLDSGDSYAGHHLLAMEDVIADLLSYCERGRGRSGHEAVVAAHARKLIDGTHISRGYPDRRRLRLLLYSAGCLLRCSAPPSVEDIGGPPKAKGLPRRSTGWSRA